MKHTAQPTPPKPERMLRYPAVEILSGLKKTTIYDGIKKGTFPRPVKLSARCVAWRESDIAHWQSQRAPAMRGNE